MNLSDIPALVRAQHTHFRSRSTRPIAARLAALAQLRDAIRARESDLVAALRDDMGKPEFEAYATEISFVYDEISFMMKQIGEFAAPEKVATPLRLLPGKSRVLREPLGVVLIIGPWNYPFQLLISPLIGALAAGNCAIVKPSEYVSATSRALRELIECAFPPEHVAVCEGGVEMAQALLKERFNHIFFTGGTQAGKTILEAAARNLTPVTLELGGKSPCVFHSDAALDVGARRIVWGKFMNAGQTCVAPDYLLVQKTVAGPLIERLRAEIRAFFGENAQASRDYARIVNERHFDRLAGLLKGVTVIEGGQTARAGRYIQPTLVRPPNLEHPIMKEEIFGPILPILEYGEIEEAYDIIDRNPKPLAFYFFSSDRKLQDEVMDAVSYGGGCVNDTVLQLANPHLPFGGVGPSGMGAYHGKKSFETFSHQKGVLSKSVHLDAKFRYPPYKDNIKIIRLLET